MRSWTLVVNAGPSALAAIAIDDGGDSPDEVLLVDGAPFVPLSLAADDPDGTTDAVAGALTALLAEVSARPDHLVFVTPGDTDAVRFIALAEAAALVGLPDPGWLPEAVARAGVEVAGRTAGGELAVVVDTRTPDAPTWLVRRLASGVDVRGSGALALGARLEELLIGLVRAKLQVTAPDFADALDHGVGPEARRHAAHLRRELRRARRRLADSDAAHAVVTVGDTRTEIARDEHSALLAHALRETVTELLRVEGSVVATTVVLGNEASVWAAELVEAADGVAASDTDPASPLHGAAALRRGTVADRMARYVVTGGGAVNGGVAAGPVRNEQAGHGDRRNGRLLVERLPAEAVAGDEERRRPMLPAVVPAETAPRRPRRRPRWAVPALSAALVLAIVGAAGVLVMGPRPAVDAPVDPRPAAIVEPAFVVPAADTPAAPRGLPGVSR